MKIKDYIKELLFTNQGVIIPGLGGFVSEYEPAAFDVNENKFLPPSKKISFNTEYNYHDNLLSEFISKKEKIDKEEALMLINDFVKKVTTQLNKKQPVDFPEIGTLSKNIKGSIQFIQSKDSNLLTDSFGLQSIKTKPVEEKPIVQPKVSTKTQKKSFKKVIILSSVSFVIVALVGLSWYLTNGYTNFNFIASDTETKEINESSINTPEKNLDSIAKADSIKALINESIDENTDLKDALFYKEPPKEKPKPKYSAFHIVAGSFKSMQNAEKFSAELKIKGYNPKIIQSGDTLYRIAIYTFSDENEALRELYKLRQNADIKSVWILKSI